MIISENFLTAGTHYGTNCSKKYNELEGCREQCTIADLYRLL